MFGKAKDFYPLKEEPTFAIIADIILKHKNQNALELNRSNAFFTVYCFPFLKYLKGLLQVLGLIKTSIGNISSLPAIILKQKISFEKSENSEKLPYGPTFPIPGPMLFMVAVTAVKLVEKSKLSRDISKSETAKMPKYPIRNIFIDLTTEESTALPSLRTFLTARG